MDKYNIIYILNVRPELNMYSYSGDAGKALLTNTEVECDDRYHMFKPKKKRNPCKTIIWHKELEDLNDDNIAYTKREFRKWGHVH